MVRKLSENCLKLPENWLRIGKLLCSLSFLSFPEFSDSFPMGLENWIAVVFLEFSECFLFSFPIIRKLAGKLGNWRAGKLTCDCV